MNSTRNMPIRVGLVGCGRIVEEGHAPVYLAAPEKIQIAALADPSALRRARVGDLLNVPAERRYADYNEMAATEKLDVVVVATPPVMHARIIHDLLAKKIPVVCEKPLAPTPEECGALVESAQAAGVGLAVIHNYATASMWDYATSVLERGSIGEPTHFSVEARESGVWPGYSDVEPNWRVCAGIAGKGCLLDQGYHFIYLSEQLLSSPVVAVRADEIGTRNPEYDVEDVARIRLRHASGAESSIDISWSEETRRPPVYEVKASRGSLVMDEDTSTVHIRRVPGDEAESVSRPLDPEGFTGMLPPTLEALASGARPPVPGERGGRVVSIIAACYESAETGLEVNIPV